MTAGSIKDVIAVILARHGLAAAQADFPADGNRGWTRMDADELNMVPAA